MWHKVHRKHTPFLIQSVTEKKTYPHILWEFIRIIYSKLWFCCKHEVVSIEEAKWVLSTAVSGGLLHHQDGQQWTEGRPLMDAISNNKLCRLSCHCSTLDVVSSYRDITNLTSFSTTFCFLHVLTIIFLGTRSKTFTRSTKTRNSFFSFSL